MMISVGILVSVILISLATLWRRTKQRWAKVVTLADLDIRSTACHLTPSASLSWQLDQLMP